MTPRFLLIERLFYRPWRPGKHTMQDAPRRRSEKDVFVFAKLGLSPLQPLFSPPEMVLLLEGEPKH